MNDMLSNLARTHGTDKALHRYTQIYAKYLEHRRYDIKRVLEIGVQGGNSLRMWKEYFPNAEIHGIDIHDGCKQHGTDRIKIHIGNQSDTAFLTAVRDQTGPLDVIIDDGSHNSDDIMTSFRALFLRQPAGSLYFIEDLADAAYYGGHDPKHHALQSLKALVDNVNWIPEHWTPPQWAEDRYWHAPDPWAADILSIHFYRFLAVVLRGDNQAGSR